MKPDTMMMLFNKVRGTELWITALLLLVACFTSSVGAVDLGIGDRHSVSLSTFDPNGRLEQVDRALQAASQGPPLMAVAIPRSEQLILAAPQVRPSPFIEDDGTARFARVSDEILIAHTGLSADGRVLVAEAQRLAVQHEYIYEKSIPCNVLLEKLSLVCQEYTMKAGARPFGAVLLVAHNPPGAGGPQFYRIDPSGIVSTLGDCAAINTGSSLTLDRLREQVTNEHEDMAEKQSRIASLLMEYLQKGAHNHLLRSGYPSILTATLATNGEFLVRRHE